MTRGWSAARGEPRSRAGGSVGWLLYIVASALLWAMILGAVGGE